MEIKDSLQIKGIEVWLLFIWELGGIRSRLDPTIFFWNDGGLNGIMCSHVDFFSGGTGGECAE